MQMLAKAPAAERPQSAGKVQRRAAERRPQPASGAPARILPAGTRRQQRRLDRTAKTRALGAGARRPAAVARPPLYPAAAVDPDHRRRRAGLRWRLTSPEARRASPRRTRESPGTLRTAPTPARIAHRHVHHAATDRLRTTGALPAGRRRRRATLAGAAAAVTSLLCPGTSARARSTRGAAQQISTGPLAGIVGAYDAGEVQHAQQRLADLATAGRRRCAIGKGRTPQTPARSNPLWLLCALRVLRATLPGSQGQPSANRSRRAPAEGASPGPDGEGPGSTRSTTAGTGARLTPGRRPAGGPENGRPCRHISSRPCNNRPNGSNNPQGAPAHCPKRTTWSCPKGAHPRRQGRGAAAKELDMEGTRTDPGTERTRWIGRGGDRPRQPQAPAVHTPPTPRCGASRRDTSPTAARAARRFRRAW